jgi:SMI1-KNR4 cell-wall
MTFSELSSHIAKKMVESAWQFEGERDSPLTPDVLNKIEAEREITLPPDYRAFLMTYGAGDFSFGHIYSPDPKSGWSLWRDLETLPDFPKGFLPFTDNGCGDYLCFPVEERKCVDRVLWADHEQHYTITSSDYLGFSDYVAKECLRLEE